MATKEEKEKRADAIIKAAKAIFYSEIELNKAIFDSEIELNNEEFFDSAREIMGKWSSYEFSEWKATGKVPDNG